MHLYDIVTIPTLKGRHPNHFKIKIINPESNIHASTVMTSCNTYKAYKTNHNLGRPQMWMFEVPALQEITQPKPRKHQIHRTSTLYNLWVYPILRYTLRMEIWPPGLQPDCTGAGNEDRHGRSQCWRKANQDWSGPDGGVKNQWWLFWWACQSFQIDTWNLIFGNNFGLICSIHEKKEGIASRAWWKLHDQVQNVASRAWWKLHEQVQSVASRTWWKLHDQVQNVAPRACWKLHEQVQSVASRTWWKLHEQVQNVAPRACWKLHEQVQSVASRTWWKLHEQVHSVASRAWWKLHEQVQGVTTKSRAPARSPKPHLHPTNCKNTTKKGYGFPPAGSNEASWRHKKQIKKTRGR